MAKVPAYGAEYTHKADSVPSITVHALKENKRPIGFAPWPEPPKRKPRARKKRAA